MALKEVIILKPILTEKMSRLEETERKYGFVVHPDANKHEVKAAVEAKFDVTVEKVGIQNRRGKTKSMTIRSNGRPIRTMGQRAGWKRAIVTLKEGDKIDFFEVEAAS
ncbi:MAG: 50S ribosomal protein L23 [Candidatus Neomarinimicrobiota bacterium]